MVNVINTIYTFYYFFLKISHLESTLDMLFEKIDDLSRNLKQLINIHLFLVSREYKLIQNEFYWDVMQSCYY